MPDSHVTCRIGSCQRHKACMYVPCRNLPTKAEQPTIDSIIQDICELDNNPFDGMGDDDVWCSLSDLRVILERNFEDHRTTSLAAQDGLVEALRKALHRLTVAAEEDMNRDEPEGVDGSEIDAANNAILNSYLQVFSDEQVAKLTGWQECELTHSLSCPNGPHGFHDDDETPLPDDLFAHSNGLFCPHCDYRQDWAPDVCFGPLPQLPDSFRAALASIEVKS